VIDFSYAGAEEILRNSARSPFPNGGGGPDLPELMKFKVKDVQGHTKPIPVKLSSSLETLKESDAVLSRELVLQRATEDHCGSGMWTINGKQWDDITEFPHLGTSEIWRFVNRSGVTHPMHMHMLFFQVLDRQPFKLEGDKVVPSGKPEPPERGERGWKDTVQVGPLEIVRVIARFEDFEGRYPYHCHLLEHEEHGMMRQFEVRAVCGDGARAAPIEECDDGNTQAGDGCSASCKNESQPAAAQVEQRTGAVTAEPSEGTKRKGTVMEAPESSSGGCAVTAPAAGSGGLAGCMACVWLLLVARRPPLRAAARAARRRRTTARPGSGSA
jgi:cysteine-rich repeat protein